MGKRSDFEKIPRSCYDTPAKGVAPLLPFLMPETLFIEPNAGKGDLVRHLQAAGHICTAAYDIEPRAPRIYRADALTLEVRTPGLIIGNPPWERHLLHPMIENFMRQRVTWLLFDADWMHTRQAAGLIRHCVSIVSIGRLIWMPGTANTGKDNCAWYCFHADHTEGPRFHGRT